MARIVIDAGHGGSVRAGNSSAYGSRSASGLHEKDVTLDIARHAAERLGRHAVLTRTDDRNLTIGSRARRAVSDGADVFVSIHANSGPPDAVGPETWVHPEAGPPSRALASTIQASLDNLRGRFGSAAEPRPGPMAVLSPHALGRQTAACLVEVDYLTHPDGARRLGDPQQRIAIGHAIADAISAHLRGTDRGAGYDRYAEAASIITPDIDYDVTSLADASRMWGEWSRNYVRWYKGVPDTCLRHFPHSAVCQLKLRNASGGVGYGTAFYIGPTKLLTVGHNFRLQRPGQPMWTTVSVEVQPGHSPRVSTFPTHTYSVNYLDLCHPRWASATGDLFERGYDLAVLHVPQLPSSHYFDFVDRSIGADDRIVVCGYGKTSGSNYDDQPQRIDGAIISVADHNTMDYPIQTEGGHSGSPVFHGRELVGVHRSGSTDHTNAGVRITPEKIDWINGK